MDSKRFTRQISDFIKTILSTIDELFTFFKIVPAGAWIITGGTFAGVMKHVGKGIRDYCVFTRKRESKIVCLGIAAWGMVIHKEKLEINKVCLMLFYHCTKNILFLLLFLFLNLGTIDKRYKAKIDQRKLWPKK